MLWKWNGYKWQKDARYAEYNMLDGYICAPGPSFSEYDLERLDGRGIFTLGLNSVYPYYKPDMWIGLDRVKIHDKRLWLESFPKVCRGKFAEEVVGDRFWREYPETYFLRVAGDGGEERLMSEVGPDAVNIWMRSTFISGLHLMMWMGFKTIYLVGTNFGGDKDYYYDTDISDKDRKKKRDFLDKQVGYLKNINTIAKFRGIDIVSCTADSPVNEFLKYKEFNIATEESLYKHE